MLKRNIAISISLLGILSCAQEVSPTTFSGSTENTAVSATIGSSDGCPTVALLFNEMSEDELPQEFLSLHEEPLDRVEMQYDEPTSETLALMEQSGFGFVAQEAESSFGLVDQESNAGFEEVDATQLAAFGLTAEGGVVSDELPAENSAFVELETPPDFAAGLSPCQP